MQDVMHEPVTIADAPNARALQNVSGEIEFDHVSFSYDTGLKQVLSDINLHVRPGESIALVGPSGGGKTTRLRPISFMQKSV